MALCRSQPSMSGAGAGRAHGLRPDVPHKSLISLRVCCPLFKRLEKETAGERCVSVAWLKRLLWLARLAAKESFFIPDHS